MIVSFEKSTAFGEMLAPPSKSLAHKKVLEKNKAIEEKYNK